MPHHSPRELALLAAIAIVPALARAESPVAMPAQGQAFAAELASVSADGVILWNGETQPHELTTKQLVAWGAPRDDASGPRILLADGGMLAADVIDTADDRLRLDSPTFGPIELPLDRVAGILFYPPDDPQRRDRWEDRLRSRKETGDRLLLENGDVLSGAMLRIDDNQIRFASSSGDVDVPRESVTAVAFDVPWNADRARSPALIVGLNDGSRLVVNQLEYGEELLRVTLDVGTTWRQTSGDPRATGAIVSLQPIRSGVTYLSDLAVESYRHVPFFELAWHYRMDRNANGTRLRAGGRVYDKGIGMHSSSRLTFRLDRPYRRLQAELAIDDQTAGRGSVVFRVLSGRRQIYASPIVRGGDPPLAMSVDITDTKLLSLIVDYADRGDELDRANWLNPRLIE